MHIVVVTHSNHSVIHLSLLANSHRLQIQALLCLCFNLSDDRGKVCNVLWPFRLASFISFLRPVYNRTSSGFVCWSLGRSWCESDAWNARRMRKTRSYASFCGRRLSARSTSSDSSGIRSSALFHPSALCPWYHPLNYVVWHCRPDFLKECHTSVPKLCSQQHWYTNSPRASAFAWAMVAWRRSLWRKVLTSLWWMWWADLRRRWGLDWQLCLIEVFGSSEAYKAK